MWTRLLLTAAVALSTGPAWGFAECPLGGGIIHAPGPDGGSIQVKGTHYDALGNMTKLKCDTKAGDFMSVITEGASPPHLRFDVVASTATCAPLEAMRDQFATFGPRGTEVQVVKNGVLKNQCVFHGYTDGDNNGATVENWAANTVRNFNGAGEPTTEKGSFTLNTQDGQIFIGKIRIQYP